MNLGSNCWTGMAGLSSLDVFWLDVVWAFRPAAGSARCDWFSRLCGGPACQSRPGLPAGGHIKAADDRAEQGACVTMPPGMEQDKSNTRPDCGARPPGLRAAQRARGVEGDRPVPERARLGHGARGLQRGRRRLGVLPARARALARLPLERGRPRRHLRPRAAHVLRARVLERPRPVPEGAHLRAHRPRRQSRRGRQGVLVVRRRDADRLVAALALPLSAGRVPVRAPARGERAGAARSDREFELVDTGVFDGDRYWQITADYAKAAPRRPLHAHPRPQRGTRGRRAARAADAVVSQPLVVGGGHCAPAIRAAAAQAAGAATAIAEEERSAAGGSRRARIPPAGCRSCCSARTTPTAARCSACAATDAVPQGRHQRPCRRRRGDRQSGAARHEDGVLVSPRRSAPGDTVELRLRLARDEHRARRSISAPASSARFAEREREADEFYADAATASAPATTRPR